MNHALPTPLQLSQQITTLIAEKAKCRGTWEQHREPLSLDEFVLIGNEINKLLSEKLTHHLQGVEK